LHDFILENLRLLHIRLTFQIIIHKISDSQGILVKEKEFKILYCKSEHGPGVCSYAYCVVENDRPGRFDIKKAKTLDIPEGELYSLLQQGIDIVDKDRVIHSSEIVGQRRPGRKIGISGDTRPSENLCNFFKNCDLLIFESTFSSNEQLKAKESYHSTAVESANLAKLASVHRLCLTHFSSRYKDLGVLLNEARSVFFSTEIAFDLKTVCVNYRDTKI
jgi:ribonuclease Z